MVRSILFIAAPALLGTIVIIALAQGDPQNIWQATPDRVRQAQAELHRCGYLQTKPNGSLDQATRTAVRRYQSEHGLPVTSRIDRPTFESLGLQDQSIRSGEVVRTKAPDSANRSLSAVVDLPGRATRSALSTTTQGIKGAGRAIQYVNRRQASRDDSLMLEEIRRIAKRQFSEDIRQWPMTVRAGLVTLTVPPASRQDPGPVVAAIRQVAGVRSVLVIAR